MRLKEISELIAEMVAIDFRPLCTVEGKGFIKLMNHIEPGYKVPSAMYIAALVHIKHEAGLDKIKHILMKEKSISLTTDRHLD